MTYRTNERMILNSWLNISNAYDLDLRPMLINYWGNLMHDDAKWELADIAEFLGTGKHVRGVRFSFLRAYPAVTVQTAHISLTFDMESPEFEELPVAKFFYREKAKCKN